MKKNKENIKKVRDFLVNTPKQYLMNSDDKIEALLEMLEEKTESLQEILDVIKTVNSIPNEFNQDTPSSVTQLKQEVLVKYLNKL